LPAGTTVHRATKHVVLADGSTLTPPPANAKPLIPVGLAWQAGGEGFVPCPKPAVATITFGVYAAVPAAYAVPAPDPSARRDGSPFQAWVLECSGVFVVIGETAGPAPAPAEYHDVIAVVDARTGESRNDM